MLSFFNFFTFFIFSSYALLLCVRACAHEVCTQTHTTFSNIFSHISHLRHIIVWIPLNIHDIPHHKQTRIQFECLRVHHGARFVQCWLLLRNLEIRHWLRSNAFSTPFSIPPPNTKDSGWRHAHAQHSHLPSNSHEHDVYCPWRTCVAFSVPQDSTPTEPD